MSPPADDPRVEHDTRSGTYRTTYDAPTESPSVRLIETVAAIRDADPTDLDRLDRYVDPDAMDAVFEPTRNQRGTHGSLSFEYEGFRVVVHSDGDIELREQA